MIITMNK